MAAGALKVRDKIIVIFICRDHGGLPDLLEQELPVFADNRCSSSVLLLESC